MNKMYYAYIAALILVLVGVLYQTNYSKKFKREIKNADTVSAEIISKSIGRDLVTLRVEFYYKKAKLKAEVCIGEDSVGTNKTLLLRVARRYPTEYIEVVKVLQDR